MRARLDFEQRAEAMQLSEVMDIDDLAYEYVGVRDLLAEQQEVIRECRDMLHDILSDEDLDGFALLDHAETTLPKIHDKLAKALAAARGEGGR